MTHTLHAGSAPLLLSLPHCGTAIPADLQADFVPDALTVPDTDWHLQTVYAFARALGASVIVPSQSRYLIDLNRPGDNAPMYPGANNTELCPTRAFSGQPLYRDGRAPDAAEVERRRITYWQPYHDALAGELARLRAAHGRVVLWDGHSIQSELPWLFDGRLPDLNLGTASGASCAPELRQRLAALLAAQQDYSQVVDGRFKGGHITRHYGRPGAGVHAVQMEMVFATYMAEEAPPWPLDAARVTRLQAVLGALLSECIAWARG